MKLPPSSPAPISRKLAWLRSVAHYPALSVSVFYRSMVGIEQIPAGPFMAVSATMLLAPEIVPLIRDIAAWFVPIIAYMPAPVIETSPALTVYAVALPLMVLYRRRQFMKALRKGTLWHGESRGVSPLEWLTSLFPCLRLGHVYGVIEPIVVGVAGFVTANTFCAPLGYWWILSALSLAAFERGQDQAELKTYLATINAVLEHRHHRYMSSMAIGADAMPAGQHSIRQSGGISTGIALDIAPQVELIRAETLPPLIGNTASNPPRDPLTG